MLEFINDSLKFVDNNDQLVDVITVDFSKAFDKISHNKLLHKFSLLWYIWKSIVMD